MKPCTYCGCVNEHKDACPHNNLDKLSQWLQGYNDAKKNNKKANQDPIYLLGWSMGIHLAHAELLNHPGC